MKARDAQRLDAIRFLSAAIKQREIELRESGKQVRVLQPQEAPERQAGRPGPPGLSDPATAAIAAAATLHCVSLVRQLTLAAPCPCTLKRAATLSPASLTLPAFTCTCTCAGG